MLGKEHGLLQKPQQNPESRAGLAVVSRAKAKVPQLRTGLGSSTLDSLQTVFTALQTSLSIILVLEPIRKVQDWHLPREMSPKAPASSQTVLPGSRS